MIFSKELMLGGHQLRANWFSVRLLYLKTLVKIFSLISRVRNKVSILGVEVRHVNGYRAHGVD